MRPRLRSLHLAANALVLALLTAHSTGNIRAAAPAQATPTVLVPEFATVRSGPGTVYDRVGTLGAGATASALGRSESGEWIQIAYEQAAGGTGWVYAPAVELDSTALETLPVIPTPPTATLPPTPANQPALYTPTLAASRPPTFTPGPQATPPMFATPSSGGNGIPPMLIILSLGAVGVLGGLMAFIRRNA